MNIEILKNFICYGNEIEFNYKNKMFSITYGDDLEHKSDYIISFCEFDQKPVNVRTVDDLLAVEWNGDSIEDIWKNLKESDIWIY